MSKLKFGGMSFGGKKPIVRIYGKTHKLTFGKYKKKIGYGFEVRKKKKLDFFLKYFYLLFPLYDLLIYFVVDPPEVVSNAVAPVTDTVVNVAIDLGGLYIPSWCYILFMFLYAFVMYYGLYLILFKGVRTWHGTEHKVISAAENNDLENVKKYNPIHERCGGTILPTIAAGYILFMIFFAYTGIPYGQMTLITILIFLNIKFFHKYDKFGIWFGKKFQKYVSIKEPEDWQLKLGTKGMKELVKAEQNKKFKAEEIVFDNTIATKNKATIKTYIPGLIIIFISLMIIIGMYTALPLPEADYITDKYIHFYGLPGETKTDYLLLQSNVSDETLNVDMLKVWGLFNPIENQTFNETIYEGLSLYISLNDEPKVLINNTDCPEKIKYWKITKDNHSFLPIKKQTIVNMTFEFVLPDGNYNETCLFNYTPIIRFTSFV